MVVDSPLGSSTHAHESSKNRIIHGNRRKRQTNKIKDVWEESGYTLNIINCTFEDSML